jgi:hypothetical protein
MLAGVTRPQMLVPALAIAALLTVAPAATAAVPPEAQPASIEFDLPANNGMEATLEASEGEITLEIGNRRSRVYYEVEGESTEAGLKAKFGKLGLIDVAFKPTKTIERAEPRKGCQGEARTNREGLFIGTIQFTGERDYVRIERTQVKGTMDVSPDWECSKPKAPKRLRDALLPSALGLREKSEPEEAMLQASNPRCRCSFLALALRDTKGQEASIFYGGKLENREGMEIIRTTAAVRASVFVFDHKAGTARVDPPFPFTGTATFKRRKGRDLWRSTLRVPLLGADPLSLRGRGFRARLHSELSGD